MAGSLLALLAAAAVSVVQLREAMRSSAIANNQRDQVVLLAARLRETASFGSQQAKKSLETNVPLSQVVESAAVSRGISISESSLRVDPGRPARIGRSDFERVPLRISLRMVTLAESIGLLSDLSASVPTMNTDEIRLTAPRALTEDNISEEHWNLEAELSQLQSRPPSDPAGRP